MERNKYYDFLRGIAIIMVIGIHTFIGGNFETTFGIINTIIRNIFNCAVPIFLAISGYFLYNKKLETIKECTCFWKKQIPKIYIPCLLYSLWYFLISIKGGENPIIAIILLFTCGFSVYYFIALITQYYLLLPVLRNINMGGSNYFAYNITHLCNNCSNDKLCILQRYPINYICRFFPIMDNIFCTRNLYKKKTA